MSTGRQTLSIVGQVIGSYFGPYGAAIGSAIGGYIGGTLDGPQQGPRLDDTSAPQIEFGGKAPRVYGRVWCALTPLWWSGLRETKVNSAGKGAADETVDNFVYSCDLLGRLADGANVLAWTRVRMNGVIVATQVTGSSDASIVASASTDLWADIELRSGGPDQEAWSVMAAAEGAADVSAYRDQCTIAITNLRMPNGRTPPIIEVEVITAGYLEGPKTVLQSFFADAVSTDLSYYENGDGTVSGNLQIPYQGVAQDAFILVSQDSADNGALTWQDESLAPNGIDPMLFEVYASWGQTPNVAYTVIAAYFPDYTNHSELFFRLGYYGDTGQVCFDSAGDFNVEYISPEPVVGRARLSIQIGGVGAGFYINDELCYPLNESGLDAHPGTEGRVMLGPYTGSGSPGLPMSYIIDEFRLRRAVRGLYTDDGHLGPPDFGSWTPEPVDLQDVLEAEMLRCAPLTADDIDMSAAAGKLVWGFKASRAASAECGVLLDWYYLSIFCGDKITVVERGGAVEQTIPYGYTGSAVDGTSDPFAGLTRGADVESQFSTAVQYINILADGEIDTQQGQRVGTGSEVRSVNFSIYSKATEAKGRADTITHDTRVAAHTATVRLGARQAAFIQPASVLRLVDNGGNSYRVRALRLVWNRGVYELDVCLDDPNILKTVGITTEVDTSVIELEPPAVTEVVLLDTAIGRDVDDDAGFYAGVKGSPRYGSVLLSSPDSVTFTKEADFTGETVFGPCVTVMPDWTRGRVRDARSALRVQVGEGELASATWAALLADERVNAFAIKRADGLVELGQFQNATLVSNDPNVYDLSGFLRGSRGAEQLCVGHAAGATFVLIGSAMRRIVKQTSDLGISEFYKAVSSGRPLTSATAFSFTDNGVGKKPYAPTRVRVLRDAATGDATITCTRRSRRSTRFASPLGIACPLGELFERYEYDVFSDDTFTTVVRTLHPVDGTSSVVYSAAEQTADGLTPGATLHLRAYQINDIVGRGYATERAA